MATLIQRIAYSNPEKSAMLLQKYQYNRPLRNVNDLITGLNNLSTKVGESAQLEIVRLHPDYNAIVACDKRIKETKFCADNNKPFGETPVAAETITETQETEKYVNVLGYKVDKNTLKGLAVGAGIILLLVLITRGAIS